MVVTLPDARCQGAPAPSPPNRGHTNTRTWERELKGSRARVEQPLAVAVPLRALRWASGFLSGV